MNGAKTNTPHYAIKWGFCVNAREREREKGKKKEKIESNHTFD